MNEGEKKSKLTISLRFIFIQMHRIRRNETFFNL